VAVFVLVHGGGHGGWCWQPVARRLRAAGHEVHAPTLTGLGERRHLLSAETGLDTHIEDISQLLFHEDLRDVVLVGHSYGGMVITGAADRCPERIARLVYLDAAIPQSGERLVDSSPGLAQFDDSRMTGGVRLGLWPEGVIGPLYGVTDPALAEWALPRLAPHPWKTFEDRLALQRPDKVAAIPRAIVNCTATLHRRPAEMLPRWSNAAYVREIDTGHDLMLTEPDEVARLLDEIAAL
jgi:pimeloyl-ACP methyl ester carboxylesterase